MKNQTSPFCQVPFAIGFNTNSDQYRDCCAKKPYITSHSSETFAEWQQNTDLKSFKQHLLTSEEWPSECWSCKLAEEERGHSFRLAVNQWNVVNYAYPCAWNIQFGNTCNLGCWICSERSSNVIFQHKKKAGILDGEDTSNSRFISKWPEYRKNILKSYDYHNVVTITLVGGEPLYNPIVKEFLAYLKANNLASRTNLEFHTNGTVYPHKLLPPISKSLWNNVCIFVSLDAVGKYAEWLRYGCNWNKIDNNLDRLIESANYTEIHCTLTVLNINQLPLLDDYARKKNVNLVIQVTDHPNFMALKNWDLSKNCLLVNPTYDKYKVYYDLIGCEPMLGSSERLINYIRSFDGIREPLSNFDPMLAEKLQW